MRVRLVVGILRVGIDGGDVLLAGIKEVELQRRVVAVLAGCAAHEPVTRALGLAGSHDVTSRLGGNVAGVVPVDSHILDELEGIHVLLVVLNHVGSHLQRTVHRHIERQLAGQRRVDVVGIVGVVVLHVHLEDARRIVHRTSLQTGEGQNGGVEGFAAVGGLIFCAARSLVTDEVRPCSAQTRRAHGLVGIDHDVVLGSLLDGIEVMVVHPLSVVMLSARDDVAHITALHSSVAIAVHQVVGSLHVALVVTDRSRRLVMHLQTDAF